MPDVGVGITPGSGVLIRTFQLASSYEDQYVRAVFGTAKGTLGSIPWTVTTAGLASVIASDLTRVGLIVTSAANGIVWVRFDSTVPTLAAYDYLLNPGDRWEVPHEFVQLAQSWAGATAGGTMFAAAATAA